MTTQPEYIGPYRWVIVTSVTTLTGAHLVIIYIIGLLLPDMIEDLDLSPTEQGWVGSSVLLANLVMAIPLNTLLSRFKPWRIIAIMSVAVAGFGFLQGWSPILAVLIIGRVGVGLGFAATMAPRALMLQQWSTQRRIALTNGAWVSGVDVVMGVGFLVTPFVLAWVGSWQGVYYFWGFVSLGLAALWLVFGKERSTGEYRQRMATQLGSPLTVFRKYPELWIVGLGMFGGMTANTGFQTFWPRLAQEQLSIDPKIVALTLAFQAFATAPLGFLVNAVPRFVGKQPLILAFGGLAVTASYVGLLFVTDTRVVLLLGIAEGVSRVYFPVLMTMVFQLPGVKPREAGVGLTFIETCIWGGGALGPLVVGFVEEATGDLRTAILVICFAPLVLIPVAGLLVLRRWDPFANFAPTRGPGP